MNLKFSFHGIAKYACTCTWDKSRKGTCMLTHNYRVQQGKHWEHQLKYWYSGLSDCDIKGWCWRQYRVTRGIAYDMIRHMMAEWRREKESLYQHYTVGHQFYHVISPIAILYTQIRHGNGDHDILHLSLKDDNYNAFVENFKPFFIDDCRVHSTLHLKMPNRRAEKQLCKFQKAWSIMKNASSLNSEHVAYENEWMHLLAKEIRDWITVK